MKSRFSENDKARIRSICKELLDGIFLASRDRKIRPEIRNIFPIAGLTTQLTTIDTLLNKIANVFDEVNLRKQENLLEVELKSLSRMYLDTINTTKFSMLPPENILQAPVPGRELTLLSPEIKQFPL